MQVSTTTPRTSSRWATPRRCSSLDELLDEVEAVTLHVDGRAGNAGIFGAEQFARMQPRSLFLNLSRGFVVDYEALRDALVSGHVAGAAVDVFPNEPRNRGDAFTSPLVGLPNTILTPHVGGSTEEAQEDIGRFVAGKLRDYALHGTTDAVGQPPDAGARRRRARPARGARPPQHPRRARPAQPGAGRARHQHRRPGARHPRQPRVRRHRHRLTAVERRPRRPGQPRPTRCDCASSTEPGRGQRLSPGRARLSRQPRQAPGCARGSRPRRSRPGRNAP